MQAQQKAVFWQNILNLIEAVEASEAPLNELSEQLASLDAIYHGAFDPVDAYPEYLTTKLCRTLESLALRT
ncbi:MAG: hypothetical protein ACE37D_02425 [Pseudomonadales bacterium]|jgi:hypothetical protein